MAMSVAATTMLMIAGAATRTDDRPVVRDALSDLVACRAAFFFAERA